jgi:AhpD family alkylhydroperoxidase
MQPRMSNLHTLAADGYKGLFAIGEYLAGSGVPRSTLHLIEVRASQINGCAFCLDMHNHDAKREGETDERLFAVAAWREAPYFTDAERAALALTEAATRLADSERGVPDDVWEEAAKHYDEPQLAGLIMAIATINAWNRINVTNRTVAGYLRRARATA